MTKTRLRLGCFGETASVETTRLLLSCPDRPGIVARVAGFLADAGRNIIDADQHSTDRARLFMRLVFESAPPEDRDELYARFASEVAEPLSMDHRFAEAAGCREWR